MLVIPKVSFDGKTIRSHGLAEPPAGGKSYLATHEKNKHGKGDCVAYQSGL